MSNNPVAYISKNGVLFKELPPEGMQLTPLYIHPSEHDLGIAESIGFDKGYQAGLREIQNA